MTAKETFLKSAHKSDFQKIVASPAFEAACQYALLTLVEQMPLAFADPSKSWDSGCVLSGARQVLEILKTLHEPPTPPASLKTRGLNYNA